MVTTIHKVENDRLENILVLVAIHTDDAEDERTETENAEQAARDSISEHHADLQELHRDVAANRITLEAGKLASIDLHHKMQRAEGLLQECIARSRAARFELKRLRHKRGIVRDDLRELATRTDIMRNMVADLHDDTRVLPREDTPTEMLLRVATITASIAEMAKDIQLRALL